MPEAKTNRSAMSNRQIHSSSQRFRQPAQELTEKVNGKAGRPTATLTR